MTSTKLAWRFKTDVLFFPSMEKRLEAATKDKWTHYSTERRYKDDWLGTKVTEHAVVKLYLHHKGIFDAELTVESEATDHASQIERAKQRLLSEILPILEAREIEEITPAHND